MGHSGTDGFASRRRLIERLCLLFAALFGFPSGARSQSTRRVPTVGVLLLARDALVLGSFVRALEARGYADGQSVTLLYSFAEGKPELLPAAASELVERKPDVIFSYSGEAAPIVQRATSSIPVVVAVSNDPVRSGLVRSLARPGGNITGVTFV